MEQNIARQIKGLQVYAGFLTAAVIILLVLFIEKVNSNNHFKEISAERVNIVEEDGKIRMVLSNRERQHPGQIDGKMIPARDRPAGMIFFNDDGDECGGLVFDGDRKSASMTYSIDQYKNDQVMQLQYDQNRDTDQRHLTYGLKLWDRSDDFTLGDKMRVNDSLLALHDTAAYRLAFSRLRSQGLLGPERMFLGKMENREVGLLIRDDKGVPRIKIALDSSNNVIIQGLDPKKF